MDQEVGGSSPPSCTKNECNIRRLQRRTIRRVSASDKRTHCGPHELKFDRPFGLRLRPEHFRVGKGARRSPGRLPLAWARYAPFLKLGVCECARKIL